MRDLSPTMAPSLYPLPQGYPNIPSMFASCVDKVLKHYLSTHACVQDPSSDVRQSAFALVGDLSRVCAPHLQPVVKQLLTLAIQNMESHCISLQNMSACNNACWSLGEPPNTGCHPDSLFLFHVPMFCCLLVSSVLAGTSQYTSPWGSADVWAGAWSQNA